MSTTESIGPAGSPPRGRPSGSRDAATRLGALGAAGAVQVPGRSGVVARLRRAGCVFAEEEADLLIAQTPADQLDAVVARRVAGEPLEQILGWVDFCGLRIAVTPGVFVPRQRTALLVREALAGLTVPRGRGERREVEVSASSGRPSVAARLYLAGRTSTSASELPVVVDLCCGTGAVGIAVAHAADVRLHAVDIDPVAVRCAERNVAAVLGGGAAGAARGADGAGPGSGDAAGGEGSSGGRRRSSAAVHLGDLDAPLPTALLGKVAVLIANAPYVPTAEIAFMPAEARDHEPPFTLDGGADGLDLHRRIAALAPKWLAPGGRLLIETSRRQADRTASAMAGAGLSVRVVREADLDATVVAGVLPG